jgi:hypothetical protein
MANDQSDETITQLGSLSPSEEMVTSLLKRTQDTPRGQRLIDDHWRKIQTEQPALARLISVNSFRQAPDDPEVREIISSSMILMSIIHQEIHLQQDLTSHLGESMNKYFPL